MKRPVERHLLELENKDVDDVKRRLFSGAEEEGDTDPRREEGDNADASMNNANSCRTEAEERDENEGPAVTVAQGSTVEMERPAEISGEGNESRGDGEASEGGQAPGEVRLRRNSIQERRKVKGPLGPCQALRLPIHRSESLQNYSPERLSDSGPESAKSDPLSSPATRLSHSGHKSPARAILSRVFSFHGTHSSSKKSPPCSPGAATHTSRKSSPSLPKKRRTLHLPVHHSPSPNSRNQNDTRFSFEWSSKSSSPKTPSPKSPKTKDSRKTKSPNSPLLESVFKTRSHFFIPSPTCSKDSGVYSVPGSPLNGTIHMMEGSGILYRPAGTRTNGSQRNHRRARSDTFREEAKQGKALVHRKRSRDDSE